MDTERKKAFLRRYLRAKRGAKALELALEELRTAAAYPGQRMDGMPRSGQQIDMAERVDAIQKAEEELREKLAEAKEAFVQVEDAVMRMPEGVQRNILIYKYLCGFPWEQVAEKLGYSTQHIFRLHGYALAEFRIPEKDESE